jgi:hypothetical protein
MVGVAAGFAVGFGLRLRYPRMSVLKQLFLFTGTTFTGQFFGLYRKLSAHMDYLHDIENPDGYKRAMENVQKIIPIDRRSTIFARNYQISLDDVFPKATSENSMITSPSLDILKQLQLTFPLNHLRR